MVFRMGSMTRTAWYKYIQLSETVGYKREVKKYNGWKHI